MRRGGSEHGSSEEREDGRGDGLLYSGRWHFSAHVGMLKLESALGIGQGVNHIRVPHAHYSVVRLLARLIAMDNRLVHHRVLPFPSFCNAAQGHPL